MPIAYTYVCNKKNEPSMKGDCRECSHYYDCVLKDKKVSVAVLDNIPHPQPNLLFPNITIPTTKNFSEEIKVEINVVSDKRLDMQSILENISREFRKELSVYEG